MNWHLSHPVHGNKPRAVQAEAMKRAAGHQKFGQWLEQGLGKTALDLNEFIESDDCDINFVVCPNSFKGDWALAPAEWGVPWVPSGYWPKHPLPDTDEYFQYSINYEAVREPNVLNQLTRLFDRRRVKLTVDEATAIKTPGTKTFKAVLELAKRAKMVRELNGTPLTQDVRDYYGQLRVLGQLNGMEPVVFRNRFAQMGGFFGKEVVGTRNEEELARILNSCTFRALKADWKKDLPPKEYVSVHLDMSARQRHHYNEMMEEFITYIENEEISADMVLTQMNKLRQISSCVLLKEGREFFFEEPKNNPKLKAVLDIIATSPGKVIVSYFYRPCGQLLFEALDKAGLDPAWIKGGMQPDRMLEQKAKFNGDSKCRVIIGQQSAAARGHTLTGKGTGRDRCATTIFYENDFSYYWRSQMEDRNYGRDEDNLGCTMYDLITSPADQNTVNILTGKKDLAAAMDQVIAMVRGHRK